MDVVTNIFVEGLPGWMRVLAIRPASLILQWQILSDFKNGVRQEHKDNWLQQLEKISTDECSDLVFEVEVMREGIQLIKTVKKD